MQKNNNILLSILMITYNQEKYIAKAIDSILMQKVDFKYEIIIGEDCSSDRTREILLRYKEKYPDKIRLLLHEDNIGMLNNWKAVLEATQAEYNAVLEGDDYWIDSHKLQIQVDSMRKNPECYISFHPAQLRLGDDTSGEIYAKQANKTKVFTPSEVILGGGGFCPTASIVFRKEVLESLPDFYYEMPVGDYILQIFASLHGGALYIDRVMSVYRKGVDGSWSYLMENEDKRVSFYENKLAAMDKLDDYLRHKYQNEISHEKSKEHYALAIFYLYNEMFDKFKYYIQLSYKTFNLKMMFYTIDYRLRFFPRVLLMIKRLKSK